MTNPDFRLWQFPMSGADFSQSVPAPLTVTDKGKLLLGLQEVLFHIAFVSDDPRHAFEDLLKAIDRAGFTIVAKDSRSGACELSNDR